MTTHTIARAFELASSGDFESMEDLCKKLFAEGSTELVKHLIASPSLSRQLQAAIRAARVERSMAGHCQKALTQPGGGVGVVIMSTTT